MLFSASTKPARTILARLFILAGLATAAPLATFPIAPAAAQTQSGTTKRYVDENLDSNGVRLLGRLQKSIPAAQRNLSATQNFNRGMQLLREDNPIAALPSLAAAVAMAPEDGTMWYQLSRANILASLKNRSIRWSLLGDATTAAYIAYQKYRTPVLEAQALVVLGDSYGHRGAWRQTINNYKLSLELNDVAQVRKLYEEYRAKYGFRIRDYKVDSDSLRPRVCFNFSEPLANGKVDFAPYVAIAGSANGAIVKEGSRLCVEGLKHGQRYSMVLRQGLPSAVGESLLKSADYEIFVRDRAPQVRFTGKNYVLPRVGQEGIPVVSTNTDKIALDIVRVGDRSLLQTVRSDDFLAQIGTYRARELLQNQGSKVWTGTVDVKPQQNEDVTTAIPVLDAVKKLEPGVYVMLAVTGDKSISKRVEDNDDFVDDIATQWFVVSDLGITSFSGTDGVHVILRSLATAKALGDVEVRLIARNNEVLATLKTDANGYAKFAPGLSRGTGGLAPGLVVASDKSGDYNFLDMVQTAFDLSDRGVKGRPAAEPLDAFVYAERGVYRSGESVNLTALLRDAKGSPVTAMPLTIVVRRPDGVEYKRSQVSDQGLGGRATTVALLPSVPTGTWRAQVYADPKSPAIGETTFLVEDYVPERLDLTLTPKDKILIPGEAAKIDVLARFLYGAPGANLAVNGEMYTRLAASGFVPGFSGYRSGLEDQEFESGKTDIEGGLKTDASGKTIVETDIPSVSTHRPVEARFVIRASEPGGRAVERVVTLPIRPAKSIIAVKNAFDNLRDGSSATFNVIALDQELKRIAGKNLRWTLYRVRNSYQWYNSEGRWKFERVKSSQRMTEGQLDVSAENFATIAMPVNWGGYRLDIVTEDGSLAPVSVSFYVGWSGEASANTPDLLDVTLDKKEYAQGDQLKLRVHSRFAGKATVAIIGTSMHDMVLADLKIGDNDITIPVKADWGASAYAVAFAHRPLDSQARRMPGRALGLAAFSVDSDKRKLNVAIETPDKTLPRSKLAIPVRIGGLTPGEEAYVTVAAVDVGILNLTRYATPNPTPHFFGQRQLSAEIRDLYGLLIDGMQGTRGAVRSGGDAAGPGVEGNRPTQEPMSRFSGLVKVGADGVATVEFDLPAFNGTARIMAVAWSKSRVGSAEKNIFIRDPVVVQATLPRLLNYGDASRFHVQIDNVDGPPGDYAVEFDIRGPVAIAATALRHSFKLAAKQQATFTVPVSASGIGTAQIDMRLTGPNLDAPQSFTLAYSSGNIGPLPPDGTQYPGW